MSTTERNDEMMTAYRMGTPSKVIARKYGLSHQYVQQLAYQSGVRYGSSAGHHIYDIVKHAAKAFNVPADVITSNSRNRHALIVRKIVYLVARRFGFSYSAIGRRMNKTHNTIMRVVRGADKLQHENEGFRKMIETLQRSLSHDHYTD